MNTLNTFLRIVISISTIVGLAVAYYKDKTDLAFEVTAYIVIAIFIYAILNKPLSEFYTRWKFRRHKLKSSFFIENQETAIEILDEDGKQAYYSEEIVFEKIGSNLDEYLTYISVSGSINSDSIKAYNCFYNLVRPNKLDISYLSKTKKEEKKIISLSKNRESFGVSVLLENSFLEKNEWWDIIFESFCKAYTFSVTFPKNRIPANFSLFEVVEGDEKLSPNQPLYYRRLGFYTTKVRLSNLSEKKHYRLKWEW